MLFLSWYVVVTFASMVCGVVVVLGLWLYRREVSMENAKVFLALVAHDIKNTLTGIDWAFGAIVRDIEDMREHGATPGQCTEMCDTLRLTQHALHELTELSESALIFARIAREGGAHSLAVENTGTVDIGMVVRGVVEAMRLVAMQKDVRIVNDTNAKQYSVFSGVSGTLLSYALRIIVDNAIKYSPRGGVVTIAFTEGRDGECTIIVRDEGIGIPAVEQKHIFSRAFRASNARMHDPNGTGVGLYLAKLLLEASGASIHFTSNNRGTVFCIKDIALVT